MILFQSLPLGLAFAMYLVAGEFSTCSGKLTKRSKAFKGRSFMARVQKSTDSSSLAEVVDRILDKAL